MKTIFRTLLLVAALGFSTQAFAQVTLKSEASPKEAKKKALVKDNQALKASPAVTPSPPVDAATAPAGSGDPNAPVLEPELLTTLEAVEDSYDFGEIIQGDVVKHTFVIKNTGSNNLILENVKPSCGCTALDWPKEPIAPGATAEIEAQFNSTGKLGAQHKNITITYNGEMRIAYLSFTGNVVPKEGAPVQPVQDGTEHH